MTDIHKRQQLREEYTARINCVIDHIQNHLADDLSLETLSHIAHFSRFHFHRIFSAMVGETLNQYIKTLGVYHDDPKVTEQAKLRSSACVTVPEDTPVEGEIGEMTVPGGQFAVAHFEITDAQFQEAWDMVMGGWFPESGYQPDDRPCYELCHNNHEEPPEKKHIVDICVPVRPM